MPEKEGEKLFKACVMEVGPGLRTKEGNLLENTVKKGDRVLLQEFSGTKVENDVYIVKNSDILATFE